MALQECRTADDVWSTYGALQARIRERDRRALERQRAKEVKPPPVVVEIIEPEPEPSPIPVFVAPDLPKPKYPSNAMIFRAVIDRYGIPQKDLLCQRRQAPLVRARKVAYWLFKELTNHTYPRIGQIMGDRDHSTIVVGVQKVVALRDADPDFKAELDALADELRGACHAVD